MKLNGVSPIEVLIFVGFNISYLQFFYSFILKNYFFLLNSRFEMDCNVDVVLETTGNIRERSNTWPRKQRETETNARIETSKNKPDARMKFPGKKWIKRTFIGL